MLLIVLAAGKGCYIVSGVVTGPERSVTQDAGAGETTACQRAQQDWPGHLSAKNINH